MVYIDTVNTEDINKYIHSGIIKGVTTNPTLFYKARINPQAGTESIFSCNPALLFIQLVGTTHHDLKKEYDSLREKYPEKSIGLKISVNHSGLEFIKYVKDNYPNQLVLGTAIYSSEQGILGALAGCDYLAPYVNRMSNENIDPLKVISTIRKFINNNNLTTKIMGASFKNTQQVTDSLIAGAHTVTVPVDILEKLFNNRLAELAINEFNYHDKESKKY